MRIILNPRNIENAAAHLDFVRQSIANDYTSCIFQRGNLVVLVRKTKTGFSTAEGGSNAA